MSVLATLTPVFFMLLLGGAARQLKWITPEQKAGANVLIMKVLFPIMIFNLVVNTSFQVHMTGVVLYTLAVYLLAIGIGSWIGPKLTPKYAHFARYLLATNEGGSVALPLYLSIVGASSNTVVFDIAGSLTCFVIVPVFVARQSAASSSPKELLRQIFTSPFILAFLFGMLLNFTGLWNLLGQTTFMPVYEAAASAAIAPISSVILFCLGYDLSFDAKIMKPLLKLVAFKTVFYTAVIIGYFILFPALMQDTEFRIAVILYFMCPTGFGMLPILSPLFQDADEEAFASGFASVYILITLAVYAVLVILAA